MKARIYIKDGYWHLVFNSGWGCLLCPEGASRDVLLFSLGAAIQEWAGSDENIGLADIEGVPDAL